MTVSACATPIAVLCALGCVGLAVAQEPARSARGGALAKVGGYQFEVFFYPTGLRVFPTDAAGAAVDTSKISATITFYHPNSRDPWFSRPLVAPAGAGATSLDLLINLATVPPTGARAEFEVAGLPGGADTPATFTVPIAFINASGTAASAQPAVPQGTAAAQPAFVFGSGAAGFGYYSYAGPQGAPPPASTPTTLTAPARTASRPTSSTSSGSFRDWSTGRNNMRLAKPWLSPRG
jgi:hypothetical protein